MGALLGAWYFDVIAGLTSALALAISCYQVQPLWSIGRGEGARKPGKLACLVHLGAAAGRAVWTASKHYPSCPTG